MTEENIEDLRSAGYLAAEIKHQLPSEGQVLPTPEPGEQVVFLPHFLRGLGFPLHPFVCRLMYYYRLDFDDLAPNSFLHISAFIVVYESLLRVRPHFSLWLKVFNVKPKVVDRQHADCGGAMVSKLPKVNWPKGVFVDTVKVWQQERFYITEPAAPSGQPLRPLDSVPR